MSQRVYTVLFVDEHNAVRSVMAEVILYQLGRGRFRTHSAGVQPHPEVHPLTLQALQRAGQGYRLEGLHPKPVGQFVGADALAMDFVLTLSDALLNDEMPRWAGQPVHAHWGCDEPMALAQRMGWQTTHLQRAFDQVYVQLLTRLRIFASLPDARLSEMVDQARQQRLQPARGPELLGTPRYGSLEQAPLQPASQQIQQPKHHKAPDAVIQ